MAWWNQFTPATGGDVEDRRKGAKTVTVTPAAKAAKSGGILAAIGLASMLGWCGHQQVAAPEPDVTVTLPADAVGQFIDFVFGDIERVSADVLGAKWRKPKLIVYTGSTKSGCGPAQKDMGPFYCPVDQRIYIDPSFFKLLGEECKADGETCQFAYATVLAHETGHHWQKLSGTFGSHDQGSSVSVELQADCFAGIWANRSNTKWHFVTPAMLTAAANIARSGGDRHGEPSHGTGAQRSASFLRGYDSGYLVSCPL